MTAVVETNHHNAPASSVRTSERRQPQPLSLRANFSWTFLGNLVFAASQCGVLVLLTKFGTTAMVGQFVLGLAVTAPIFMFCNLQLRLVQATDTRRDFTFSEYVATRVLMTAVALGGTAVAALVAAMATPNPAPSSQVFAAVLCIGLVKAVESISDIFYGQLQQRERMDRIGKSLVQHGCVSLAVTAATLAVCDNLLYVLGAMTVSRLLVLMLYDFPQDAAGLSVTTRGAWRRTLDRVRSGITHVRSSCRWRRLLQLAALGLPLAGTALLISLNTGIPRYFVAYFQGVDELGIFGAIAYFMVSAGTFTRALNQSTCPRLARYFTERRFEAFRALFVRLILLYAVLGAISILVVPLAGMSLLTALFRPEYGTRVDVFLFVMIGMAVAFQAGLLETAMVTIRRGSTLLLFMALTILITTVLSAALVPWLGITGAAMTLALAKLPLVAAGLAIVFATISEQQANVEE